MWFGDNGTDRKMEMLRFSLGMIRMDKSRNETKRLRWFKHVQRRNTGYIGQRMSKMELPGKEEDLRGDLWI